MPSLTFNVDWFRLKSSWQNKNAQIVSSPTLAKVTKTFHVSGLPDGAAIQTVTLRVSCGNSLGGANVLDARGVALTANQANSLDFTQYVTGNGEWPFLFRFQDYGVASLADGAHYGTMMFTDVSLEVVYTGEAPDETPVSGSAVKYPESTGICLYDPEETDFTSNGLGLLFPQSCTVTEEAGGEYEMALTVPADQKMLWPYIQAESVIKCPVPLMRIDAFTMAGAEYWKIKSTEDGVPVKSKIPTMSRVPSISQYPAWSSSTKYHRGDIVSYQGKAWRFTASTGQIGLKTLAPGSATYWTDVTSYNNVTNSGKTLATLGRNEIITKIDDATSGWIRIRTSAGVEGYIQASYAEYYSAGDSAVGARVIRNQLFRVYRVEKDSDTMTLSVSARHISYDFSHTILAKCEQKTVTVPTALSIIRTAMVDEDNRQLVTDISDSNITVDLDCSWENGVSALLQPDTGIVAQLQARLIRDNDDFFILSNERTDRGFRIIYGKNLGAIHWTIDTSNMCTRVVPHCKDANGDDLLMLRLYVDSPFIDDYPRKYVRPLSVNCQVGKKGTTADGQEVEELTEEQCRYIMLAEAEKVFKDEHADVPEITIDVDLVMLGTTANGAVARNSLENLYMYDGVHIEHPYLKIDEMAYMSGYEYDCILKRYNRVKFTNTRKKSFHGVSGFELSAGTIKLDKLSASAIDALKA